MQLSAGIEFSLKYTFLSKPLPISGRLIALLLAARHNIDA
jgi:hypothetical protein